MRLATLRERAAERPLKIVMVHTMYAPNLFGGAEHLVQMLAEGLVAAGGDVVVVAASPDGPRDRELNGVRVREVGLANLHWPYGGRGNAGAAQAAWHAIDIRNPWMAARAARIITEESPDVVHTHNLVGFSTLVWRDASRADLPLVHTLHDHRLHCVRAGMFVRGNMCLDHCVSCRVTTPLKRTYASGVDLVTAVSDSVLSEHLEAGFFADADHEVIPVPVRPVGADGADRRDGAVLRIGYLGRLHPGKGVESLIDATVGLPALGWELSIAGEGDADYERSLRDRPRHRNARFVGHVDPDAFLRSVDVLVVPSRWMEPAGLVVAEAFARGVPVVAAARGGLPEMVVSSETGYLFDPDVPGELATIVAGLIADRTPLDRMSEACREAAEPHAVDRVVARHARSYERAIDRRRARGAS